MCNRSWDVFALCPSHPILQTNHGNLLMCVVSDQSLLPFVFTVVLLGFLMQTKPGKKSCGCCCKTDEMKSNGGGGGLLCVHSPDYWCRLS